MASRAMAKSIIATSRAPAAVGPYSQAVRTGDLLFTAGQVALDPQSGKLIEGDIAAQTHQALRNLAAVLEEAGCSFDQVVKTTVFLADMDDFSSMNEVYGQYFGESPPARSTVQVARLPLGARVEIEAVASLAG